MTLGATKSKHFGIITNEHRTMTWVDIGPTKITFLDPHPDGKMRGGWLTGGQSNRTRLPWVVYVFDSARQVDRSWGAGWG